MMRMPFLLFAAVAAVAAGSMACANGGRTTPAAASEASGSDGTASELVSADPHGTVEVSNFSGKVEVSGWDQPQVSVHSKSSGGVNNVDVRSEHGRTSIAVRLHGISWGGGEAYLQIKIPRNSELDVTSVSADVVSTGILGTQRLKTVSGSITADISRADVEAKTVSGDVILHGDGKPADLRVSSISGSISLDRGAGDIEAVTVSGDLTAELQPGRAIRARTTSGNMVIRGKLAKDADLELQTVSGDVRLHVGYDGGYEYEASTFSGDIRNCFKQETERTSRYGPGERLTGTRGNGSGHVRVKTMDGEIDLCDKS